MRYAVIATGSKANCAVVEHQGEVVLIDCGVTRKLLEPWLVSHGLSRESVKAIVLTHDHGDHRNDSTLRWLGCPVWSHELHKTKSETQYRNEPFNPVSWARFTPISLFHDSPGTTGFRIDEMRSMNRDEVSYDGRSFGHICDTGTWTLRMARELSGVDVLAIESNHDVQLQLKSDRPIALIERNLGMLGHLSNEQASALAKACNPKSIVLLHISQQCNDRTLAESCMTSAVPGIPVTTGPTSLI